MCGHNLCYLQLALFEYRYRISIVDISRRLKNIDIDMVFFENIDIDMVFFENIDIDKAILKNIDIDRKSLRNIDIDKGIIEMSINNGAKWVQNPIILPVFSLFWCFNP